MFIGIDEVGRGALAGPVVACAFTWKYKDYLKIGNTYLRSLSDLNDSKELTRCKRKELFKPLTKVGKYALGYASVLEIEKLNILNATFLAMKRAYEALKSLLNKKDFNSYVLVDGNKFNPFINCRQLPIIDGDAKSSLIASASIIAKLYRDSLMERLSLSDKFNLYGWHTNVGYGTREHKIAIRQHGITPLHRKLFVRKALSEEAILLQSS
ncbi:MAG: ribonuclease HII [Candidatus Melainabacteria bacterium]|nr:ribonuclease HII [Candidatus Melainabacteria bacterium]